MTTEHQWVQGDVQITLSLGPREQGYPVEAMSMKALLPSGITTVAVRDLSLSARRREAIASLSARSDDEQAAGPDDRIAAVARAYEEALHLGAQPNKYVQEALGLPRSTVSNQILRARELGILPPSTRKPRR